MTLKVNPCKAPYCMGCCLNEARDWTEDFEHENGQYFCRCHTCGHLFIGYKRRITCKMCALEMEAK